MKIACVSDLHGHLPPIPDCDLLIIAGDIVPLSVQRDMNKCCGWLNGSFRNWVEDIFNRGIVICGIAGNHDILFQHTPNLLPRDLLWHYIQDNLVECKGLKIWGSPWQLNFGYGWAFNASEEELRQKYNRIPNDVDVIISHGPPYGYGDTVIEYVNSWQPKNLGEIVEVENHVGSKILLETINRANPKLVVTGHCHEGYGVYQAGKTTVVNASLLNDKYQPVNEVIVVEI
jgi:Icc-related predicted phosphoesterase